jgi:hypothetical protein
MASIFDLKTSVEELSSANQGTSRMDYDQHPPTRDVTTTNFPNGAIHFRFQTSGQKWWIPSRSYLRIRCLLAKADGTQLLKDDNIAPNMGLCASLFQSAEFRINDKTVSRISDFMPQVDAIETRLSKSKSHLDGIGQATNLWDVDFAKRQSVVTGDAVYNPVVVSSRTSRTQLGFDAATNTVAIAADTGVLTFAQNGGAVLPNPLPFEAGDEIEIVVGGNVGTVRYTVSNVINATTIQLNNLQTIAVGAAALAFTRIRQASSNEARGVSEFELTWTPPLSIFKVGHALPSGKYELVLNPQTASVYQKYAIQSTGADKVPNTATVGSPSAGSNYIFNIQDMYFYCNTVEGPRADDITYLLDLEQTNCQSEQFSANQQSFQQRNFDVSPSTYALSVAYQDARSGSNTLHSSSIYKVSNVANTATDEELKLNRFFINYAGQNLPAPDADPNFTPTIDYTTQRYVESQIYSGALFDTGGGESIQTYHDRGSYYYFAWPRDGTDRSTRVNVHQAFQGGTDTTHMRLLLFSHSKQVARVRVQDGRVVDVQLEDA